MKGLALLMLFGACAGRSTDPPPAARHEVESAAPAAADERLCAPDPKDPLPCARECDRGLAVGCMLLAARAEKGKDYPHAVALFERACELHEAQACASAARLYARGAGAPPSRTKQLELLVTACQLGDSLACITSAKAFSGGLGVPKDPRRATDLWQHACTGGQQAACDLLADAGL